MKKWSDVTMDNQEKIEQLKQIISREETLKHYAEENIKNAKIEIELLKNEKKVWKLKYGEIYNIINGDGVIPTTNSFDKNDNFYTSIGMTAPYTPEGKKKLENKIKQLQAQKLIEDWYNVNDGEVDWKNDTQVKYMFMYSYKLQCTNYISYYNWRISLLPAFTSFALINKCKEEIGCETIEHALGVFE